MAAAPLPDSPTISRRLRDRTVVVGADLGEHLGVRGRLGELGVHREQIAEVLERAERVRERLVGVVRHPVVGRLALGRAHVQIGVDAVRDRPLAEHPRVTSVAVDDPGHELGQVGILDLREADGEQVDPPPHPVGVTGERSAEPATKDLLEL